MIINGYKIYLDVCCLNRPFDDQSQLRIRLETESIITIINQIQLGLWKLINSTALEAELSQHPNLEKLKRVKKILSLAKIKVLNSNELQARATEIKALGFSSYDAVHIASAERSQADVFLTTDDRLLKRSKNFSSLLRVNIDNPVQWLANIIQTEARNDENTKRNC